MVAALKRARGGQTPATAERQRLARRARSAGPAVIPRLVAALESTADPEISLATYLLARIGGDRVIQALESLCAGAATEAVQARAVALLSDLQAPTPLRARLRDPEALLADSVRDLLTDLDQPEDLDQAVALIIDQVPDPEVPLFVSELLRHGGPKAAPVIAALRARGGLSEETLSALGALAQTAGPVLDAAALYPLERGLACLEKGRPGAARRHLERFVARHPDHAEGRSALGICLLELDALDDATDHLTEAVRLEPHQPLHRWNLASAAKQANRMGGCYLALRDYLALHDESAESEARQLEAKSFLRAYERTLRGSHSGMALSDVLRGEEQFARAYAALAEGQYADAAVGFENVLALVPRHYPSWGNLGAAYLALDRIAEAQRCFERALELNPDYAVAKHNLQLLDSRR